MCFFISFIFSHGMCVHTYIRAASAKAGYATLDIPLLDAIFDTGVDHIPTSQNGKPTFVFVSFF